MASDRFVVLGLSGVRSTWTTEVTGWAMSGALALEFVKCVSIEELKARLRGGRTYSAILCDGDLPGLDRDLFALAAEFGVGIVVIGQADRDYDELGAAGRLHEVFGRADLLQVLETAARPVRVGGHLDMVADEPVRTSPFTAQLVAVTGRTGSGVSTTSMAIAQAFGSDGAMGGLVVLADFGLDADLAMLHDATDIVPGIQELVDAHRTGRPSHTQIRAMTHAVPHRRYDLLLGLRRHRDWVTLRPRAFDAALQGLRRSYRLVVADIANDFEGETETGSIDVEERNVAARAVALAADAVVAVGDATLVGIHGLVQTIDGLIELGVPVSRIQPVINRAPRSPRARADLTASLSELVDSDDRGDLATPIHLHERRHLDDVHRNGTALPDSLCGPLLGATTATLRRNRPANAAVDTSRVPEAITPGSLGTLSDDAA